MQPLEGHRGGRGGHGLPEEVLAVIASVGGGLNGHGFGASPEGFRRADDGEGQINVACFCRGGRFVGSTKREKLTHRRKLGTRAYHLVNRRWPSTICAWRKTAVCQKRIATFSMPGLGRGTVFKSESYDTALASHALKEPIELVYHFWRMAQLPSKSNYWLDPSNDWPAYLDNHGR